MKTHRLALFQTAKEHISEPVGEEETSEFYFNNEPYDINIWNRDIIGEKGYKEGDDLFSVTVYKCSIDADGETYNDDEQPIISFTINNFEEEDFVCSKPKFYKET